MNNNRDWLDECYDTYYKFYLKDAKFRKAAFVKGEHEHCLFDSTEISGIYSNAEKQGYFSETNHFWLCAECFEECAKRYKMTLLPNTLEMVENALNERKALVFSLENIKYEIKHKNRKIAVLYNDEETFYDDALEMQRNQRFYGKYLREIIDDLYITII